MNMIRFGTVAMCFLVAGQEGHASALADDSGVSKERKKSELFDSPILKEFRIAIDEYREAIKTWRAARADAKTESDRNRADKLYPDGKKYASRMILAAIRAAEQSPHEKGVFEALSGSISFSYSFKELDSERDTALDIHLKHHLSHPQIGDVISLAKGMTSRKAEEFLQTAVDRVRPSLKPASIYALAIHLKYRSEEAQEDSGGALINEAEKLFIQIIDHYADSKNLFESKGTFGETAERELFEIRHHTIGKTAPEIVSEDTDGVSFKLSDYRGKVVVLDFWGHW